VHFAHSKTITKPSCAKTQEGFVDKPGVAKHKRLGNHKKAAAIRFLLRHIASGVLPELATAAFYLFIRRPEGSKVKMNFKISL